MALSRGLAEATRAHDGFGDHVRLLPPYAPETFGEVLISKPMVDARDGEARRCQNWHHQCKLEVLISSYFESHRSLAGFSPRPRTSGEGFESCLMRCKSPQGIHDPSVPAGAPRKTWFKPNRAILRSPLQDRVMTTGLPCSECGHNPHGGTR
jgi:hypothetical protein